MVFNHLLFQIMVFLDTLFIALDSVGVSLELPDAFASFEGNGRNGAR